MTTKELYEHHYKQILSEEDYRRLREGFDHKRQLFDKKCLNYIPEDESESRLKKALKRLDEIQPPRTRKDRKILKEEVIDVCFIFFHERRNGDKDFSRKGREKNKAFKKDLDKLIEKYPHVMNFDLQPPSSHQNQKFLLNYPDPIKPMQETNDPEVNTLLFQLCFLFRKFSDPALKDGEWDKNLSGQMPQSGSPHYDIITDIFNAVVHSTKIFDISTVRDRIRNLSILGTYLYPPSPPHGS